MKLYTFTHEMLSSPVQGVQAAHAITELFVKYRTPDFPKHTMLYEWAEDYKTLIKLNGGNSVKLHDLYQFLADEDNEYPWAVFHEDESIDGILTGIAIVLPQKIYDIVSLIRQGRIYISQNKIVVRESVDEDEVYKKIRYHGSYSDFDVELIDKVSKARLAK